MAKRKSNNYKQRFNRTELNLLLDYFKYNSLIKLTAPKRNNSDIQIPICFTYDWAHVGP